jgi:hypothetical protein
LPVLAFKFLFLAKIPWRRPPCNDEELLLPSARKRRQVKCCLAERTLGLVASPDFFRAGQFQENRSREANMGKFDAIIEWCKARREADLEFLRLYESGRMKSMERVSLLSEWRDITPKLIEEGKIRIAEMERLIAAYEKHND